MNCCAADGVGFNGESAGGRYAMWPTSVDGSATNNHVFSSRDKVTGCTLIVDYYYKDGVITELDVLRPDELF